MCTRFTMGQERAVLAKRFGFDPDAPALQKRWNQAPGQDAAVVVFSDGRRRLDLMRWGLVPFWAEDPKIGSRLINARAESLADKPSFREAFRSRRCLVPADGFYEWAKGPGNRKQPLRFVLSGGAPFAFAGLWESWEKGQSGARHPLITFTIITTQPNDLVSPVHNRMPVILKPGDEETWFSGGPEEASRLLRPYPAREMESYAVSTRVNSPANEGPELIEPVAEQGGLFAGGLEGGGA